MMDDNTSFEEILTNVKKYMILEGVDEYIIDLILSSILSIYTERPVWMSLIGPPASGKSELLNIVRKVDKVHFLSNISAKTLFSGHSSANGGFMIREVKKRGIILFTDWTTIISKDSSTRKEIYNQLRIIHDGEAGLETGIETGNKKVWKGKIALIVNVTEAIEKFKNSSNDLGERFLYFNYNPKVDASRIIAMQDIDVSIKIKVQEKVKLYLESLKEKVSQFKIIDEDKEYLLRVSKIISIGRSVVERDSRTRAVEHVHFPEMPHRIYKALSSLFISLMLVNGDKDRTKEIISTVAYSTIPVNRKKIIIIIKINKREITTREFYDILKVAPSKLARTLEDMLLQDIIQRRTVEKTNTNYYKLTNKFESYYRIQTNDD
jgi:DNA-binding HxlR family transcriptional regulator